MSQGSRGDLVAHCVDAGSIHPVVAGHVLQGRHGDAIGSAQARLEGHGLIRLGEGILGDSLALGGRLLQDGDGLVAQTGEDAIEERGHS
jgi:hypothetical protein